jgi:hypothetical protein
VFAPLAIAIEIRLGAGFVSALVSALEGHGTSRGAFSRAFSTAVRSGFSTAHFGALFLQDGFARQLNAIAIDGQYLHQHLVAFLQLIANVVDTMLSDFADVQQPISAWQNLDERAKIGQPRNFAEIGFAYLSGCSDVANHLERSGSRRLIARRDIYLAAVLDVDLDAGGFDNAANHLAAGANEICKV